MSVAVVLILSIYHIEKFLSNLEWRQPERVPTILDSEKAHEKAVHSKNNRCPDNGGDLLGASVFYSRNFKTQRDGSEREDGI